MSVEQRAAQPTAVVRRRTTWARFPHEWKPMLDEVYAFLRAGGAEKAGHNVMVYRDRDDGGVDVEVGVEVAGPFAQVGAVEPSELPAGTVAVAVHRGPYDQFEATYTALRRWCAAQGLTLAGPRWEVYGDWADDPAALETEIAYLVAPED